MSIFSTPAILLRRIDYGDHDLILTLLTFNQGKIAVIAKSAKKSKKRFQGVLEFFSVLDVIYRETRAKGLPVLQEAVLKLPFDRIREDIKKMAYASYWAELLNEWLEEGKKQTRIYHLFHRVLAALDQSVMPDAALSIWFQMRFLKLSGLNPNLTNCRICHTETEKMGKTKVVFDLVKGGLVCEKCVSGRSKKKRLSKGTIKQLQWIESDDPTKAARIRLTLPAIQESQGLLEAFVPYHLGREPRSLKVLQQIRDDQ